MGLIQGVLAAAIEKAPLVKLADRTGDGNLELVIGPTDGTLATVLRHLESRSLQIGPVVFVLGNN